VSAAVVPANRLPRIFVTGAGGAAAVTLLRALAASAELTAGDIDPVAVGLYLVPPLDRVLLPRGDDRDFVDVLLKEAIAHNVDLVIPTVDSELRSVSAARGEFAAHGIALLVETTWTLDACLDKFRLMQLCADVVAVPKTVLLTPDVTVDELAVLGEPFIVKPRRGAGGRGFEIIRQLNQGEEIPRDGTIMAQEYLPGTEYSIDVLARPDGCIVAAVPRLRDRVDSGIAIAGRTVHDEELEEFGRRVATSVAATGVVNVQARRRVDGTAALLEVNARFPGTMALTMAAGVNMPVLAVDGALGRPMPRTLGFTDIALVRHWADVVVPIGEYRATASDWNAHLPSTPR
jgi:carbamoyl-phosphate synthase large subunit